MAVALAREGHIPTIERRKLVAALLGAAAAAWPLAGRAQDATDLVRIGFLPIGSSSNDFDRSLVESFRQGLSEFGLVENRDVTIDIVWVSIESEFPQAVSDLLKRGAKLLVTAGSSASAAAKRHTSTVPIVFVPVGDPVGIGLVESLAHPGGDATGFSDVLADLSGKYVQFAIELGNPRRPVDYLGHTDWPDGKNRLQASERAAQASGVTLRSRGIADIAQANDVLAAMKQDGALTLIVQPSPFTYRHRNRLIDTGMNHSLGMIVAWPSAARDGALIAYGPDYPDLYRKAASYVGRILKGTNPADLPVQEPTKFGLGLNLKTAKTLGLTMPPMLLTAATEVIE
jgi:putative ABC transport system substrate-binding protein